jgi:hypothetical protein
MAGSCPRGVSVRQVLRGMTRSLAGAAVAVLDLLIVAVYRSMIYSQLGPRDNARIGFVSIFILLLAVLSVIGALTVRRLPRVSAASFIASGTGQVSLGILAIFSIGWPLILGGLPLMYIGITGRSGTFTTVVASLVILVLLGLGIAFT